MKEGTSPREQISACRAIIIWKDKVLLHHRDDKPDIPNPGCWTFPGGAIEKDETPARGIIRELIEEASYSPNGLQFIGFILNENATHTHFFFSYVDEEEAKLFKKGAEGQGIGFFTLNEIDELGLPPLFGKLFKKYRKVIEDAIRTNQLPSPQALDLIV